MEEGEVCTSVMGAITGTWELLRFTVNVYALHWDIRSVDMSRHCSLLATLGDRMNLSLPIKT